jgi:hypothetical protein
MMGALRGVLFGLGMALAAAPAWSQVTTLSTSEAVACLTPPVAERGVPEYPTMSYKSSTPGRVVAMATFRANDLFAWPSVTIEKQEGGDDFVDAVKAHLRTLRVPCLPRDGQATLRFDFVFNPDSRRAYWYNPVDTADAGRLAHLACVVSVEGAATPDYSREARRAGIQGRVWARLRFVAADQPPEVTLHHRPQTKLLAKSVSDWLKNRRMPCFDGEPISVDVFYIFMLIGDVYGFRPLDLTQYLARVKGIQQQTLAIDTTTMGCPFDLKLRYLQPDGHNRVAELGEPNPARRPLLDWLATTELDMRGRELDSIYADDADIAVPCVKINLKPKE